MAKQSEATLLLRIKRQGDELLSSTGTALAQIGKVAAAAFATASAAAAAALHQYREQELAVNQLNQSLISQGIYSKALSQSYQKMASDLQEITTYSDDAIIAAQTQLQTYLGQTKITKELTQATLDFATAKKMDLESAAQMIGKSIGTNTNILARHKIAIDENLTVSEKMAQATRALEAQFGGQAIAAAQGLGALSQMKNSFDDLLKLAGQQLAPVITFFVKEMTQLAYVLREDQQVIDAFATAARGLAQVGVFVKNVFIGVGETIGQVFATLVATVLKLSQGKFKEAFVTIEDGFSGTADSIGDRYETFKNDLASIDQVFADQKKREDQEELDRLSENNAAKHRLNENLVMTQEQMFAARDQREITRLLDQERLKDDVYLRQLNQRIARETDHTRKLDLESQKRDYLDQKYDDLERRRIFDLGNFKQNMNSKAMHEFEGVLSNMAQMQNSKSAILVGIGKAAATAQMAISTARGAVEAFSFGASLGGPVVGGFMAAPIIAYGGTKAIEIAGINLAEGGLVKATPGGVMARIGEGGKDEMVVPIDNNASSMFGTKIVLNVNGGFLGSEIQAKEFAKAVDLELLKLRRSNESLAFDRGVI